MRNLTPGSKFSVLLATLLLITLAVSTIGFAEAEKTESQKEKRNSEDGKKSVKTHRSTDFADRSSDKSAFYKKWEAGSDLLGEDDDTYSSQADPSGSDSYEGDGYGYDDDEYDHFNYKRYDAGKGNINRDAKLSDEEEEKNSLGGEKSGNVAVPEATTIELLSFQAKNVNPMSDNAEPQKEDTKMKQFAMKKPPYSSDKADEKDALVDEKLKKKTSENQKTDGNNASDKNTGNVKYSEDKSKESGESKVDKGKISDTGTNPQPNVLNLKESESKGNSASVGDGKRDAKIEKSVEVKIQPEGKDEVKMKAEKEADGNVSDGKEAVAKDESNDKNVSQFEGNPDYKDRFVNVNDPVIADDEKGSEDNGMNLAGLRDSRNELPYQYSQGFRFLKKKEAERRTQGARSAWESPPLQSNDLMKSPKEPFHLDFPLSEVDNTDYHRNYLKSLKRFKGKDESAGILGQGDTPSPYLDESKKRLASKIIEEEQRKRRSRLRRLKPNPLFIKGRGREEDDEEEDTYGYSRRARARANYGMYRGNPYNQPGKSYRRRGNSPYLDTYDEEEDVEEEETKNVKSKREDDAGFYSDKKKNQGKVGGGWSGGENNQKKKLKELNLSEEPSKYNTPLVLLRRNDNGQQAIKTFVDGRRKNEEGIDSEDLARLLSRDSNYVVLKKVPDKEQLTEGERSRSGIGDSRREKFKVTQIDVAVNGNRLEDSETIKTLGKLKDLRGGERPVKAKENRIEDLSDFFKGDVQDDRDFDEKKEMLMSIDNRLNLYQRGEPNKKLMFKPPSLSQAYRHMKDLDDPDTVSDREMNSMKLTDKKGDKVTIGGATPERLIKSYKKDGKEYLVVNKPFSTIALRGNAQGSMIQNSVTPLTGNTMSVGSGNLAAFPNGMAMMVGASMAPTSNYQNVMMTPVESQEIKLQKVQSGSDGNRKYFLFGSEGVSNTPKHEVKVMQGDFNLPPGSPYDSQTYQLQTYNKALPMNNPQGGKAQPFVGGESPYTLMRPQTQPHNQQCMANGYRPTGTGSAAAAADGFKRAAKKDESSGGLQRFMRDFQDFSQASYPHTYKSTDMQGMSLQELTARGDKHLQKLNSLLKEIMSNKPDESGGGDRAKNLKRGMFQKYKDQKNWQLGEGASGDVAQVRSGKWTSVVYDGASQMAYSGNKSPTPEESPLKNRKLQGKDAPTMLRKDILSPKRMKRQSGYDSKDSTKMLEQKVKSTPYHVQPQPLFPTATANTNANQQHKSSSTSRVCLQLPPDKIMDLLSFYGSDRENFSGREVGKEELCRRYAPIEEGLPSRQLRSLSEDETENRRESESVRKSFESYLDPLVRKLEEYEAMARIRRRTKREIDSDESMPNDFNNFLVTSLGEFGSQKREVVKKDEVVWDSGENREESVLGKRETSGSGKTEKKSVSKDEATNIRIKIVDGNGMGELESKPSEEVKAGDGDARVHEVYLITNGDSKKRKKKKFASVRSDQSPQKQPISNHLPQVETVYNPSPGNNKAQMEKIISGDTQMKGKCVQSQTVYNASASMMEDNIIRNNLRTGNINTFTYQQKEEPTPYPLQGATNTPSSEFEMLNSKSLPSSKAFNGYSGLAGGSPDIIYKDEVPQEFSKGKGPVYRSNPDVRVLKNGAVTSERYLKDGAEGESAYAEYEEADANGIAEEQENGRDGYKQDNREEYRRADEHLDPKMVAIWNDYARTHLTPEKHKEAMEREFQEAFFRSSGQVRFAGANLNQPFFGANLMQNMIPKDFNELERLKSREKLTKRVPQQVPIGRRFFYTFKSQVPEEEYYSLYQEPFKQKTYSDNWKVGLISNQQPIAKGINSDNLQGNRVKRSEEEEPKVEKRLSSGHLTENNYRKYHKKNLKEEGEEEKRERVKRDSLADYLKADMMRRIEEEKKIRSKVKGLSSDLTKNDIPLIGSPLQAVEPSLRDLLLQQLEEKKEAVKPNSYMEDQQQQQQQQQQQFGNLKTSSPDVLKNFEIKRGRRENAEEWSDQHAIVTRADSETYRDRVFLKGISARKVKKYSDEGFEPLTPDSRFTDRASYYSDTGKAYDEPFRVALDERVSPSGGVHRREGDKKDGEYDDGQQKYQKMTHGFSHEAPLLTPNTPLKSPRIFDALKDTPPQDPSLRKHLTEFSSLITPADLRERSQFKSNREPTREPTVNAVLVLTKREDASRQRAEEEKSLGLKKRKADWGDASQFRPNGHSPEIVNEEGECRSSGCETPTKTANNKMAPNVKQSCFPFSQLHNHRKGGGSGNCGEEILESILGRVESNPHFRRVIGPGLRWRNTKCHAEGEDQPEQNQQSSSKGLFVRQVKTIVARFVNDMEKLASQDFTQNVCSKLDSKSSKFLHELLAVPVEVPGICNRRKFLGAVLSDPSVSAGRPGNVGATQNRRELVAKLLEEYRRLPDDEKRSVQALGQYLNHEMDSLNRALNPAAESGRMYGERMDSATFRGSGEKRARLASNAVREAKPVKVEHSFSDPEAAKVLRNSFEPERVRMPDPNELQTTENGGVADYPETTSPDGGIIQPESRLGELDKLGDGDAAGLQQSLKSHEPWLSNLNMGKGKPVQGWQKPKKGYRSDPEESLQLPLSMGNRSVSNYDISYQDYSNYDFRDSPEGCNRHCHHDFR